jgi:hypothetical protein
MKSCCADFESHLLKENPGVGLLYYYRSGVGATVFVSNRDEGATLSKPAFAIRFCPLCGKNLLGICYSVASCSNKEMFYA